MPPRGPCPRSILGAERSLQARELPISRQAVAKHLSLLAAAELVDSERRGRETRYTLRTEPLHDVSGWARAVGAEWEDRLARLQGSLRAAD